MRLLLFLAATSLFAQQHGVSLTWTDILNPAGTTYFAYRATGDCTGTPVFTKLTASASGAKSYFDVPSEPGTYCYQVTAFFALDSLESAPSTPASVVYPGVKGHMHNGKWHPS